MSNDLCQSQIMNFDFPSLNQESELMRLSSSNREVNTNSSSNNTNQQEILQKLLLALTNQFSQANKNINHNFNQNLNTISSMFEDFRVNDRNNNDLTDSMPITPTTANSDQISTKDSVSSSDLCVNRPDFKRSTSLANSGHIMSTDFRSLETSSSSGNSSCSNISNNNDRTNKLSHIESFNLDNHLDFSRFTYFDQSVKDQSFLVNRQTSVETLDVNLDNCLTVDCNIGSLSSCQFSSSSTSSSNSSISNLSKNKSNNTGNNETITQSSSSFKSSELKSPKENLNKKTTFNKKSQISFLDNKKLSGNLSSSSDCLSGDEGYFGSYSDSKNMNQEPKLPMSFNQPEQVILLKYLLQNQHITQLNNLESALTNDSNNNIESIKNETEKSQHEVEKPNELHDCLEIPCLNIFNPVELSEEKFTSLLSSSPVDEFYLANDIHNEQRKFDVINLLSRNEKNFNKFTTDDTFDSLKLKEEVVEILKNQQTQRSLQEELDEMEMRTVNWRQLLDKRTRLERYKRMVYEEDDIDLCAYLNEIEMNLDHFQSGDVLCSDNDHEDVLIDTLLKFRTNNMAFNLRNNHRNVELELEQRRLNRENQEKNIKFNMFANVHVDSIPEFMPYSQDQFYEYKLEEHVEMSDGYDQTYIHQTEQNPIDLDYEQLGEDCQYQILENDYTMVNEELNEIYDENGYLVSAGATATVFYEDDLVDTADLVDCAESEYFYEEDYEDYEDQVMVDSLSEQDALNLLRNESEMYALQMAQASKSGLLPKSKNSRKKKGRFNSGNSSTTTQSTETSSDQVGTGNMDIFENVFNFDEVIRNSTITDSSSDLASSSASISGTTESENCVNENLELDINEFLMPQFQDSGSGNISMSLRNSLLRLRHTRRHLAKLIDSKKPSSASSSTSSSLTNSTGTHLAKQITISALSRKPCVYMLNEGRCMRADCRFAHDLKQITCKYWIDGECLKGENCEFLHEKIEETTPQPSSSQKSSKKILKPIPIKKKDFKLDTDEFPALGGGPAPVVPKLVEFPPLGASPVSITATTVIESSKELPFKKTSDALVSKTPPQSGLLIPKAVTINPSIKTAASVLKTNTVSSAVNIVQNKQQQIPSSSQKVSKMNQSSKPNASNIQSQKYEQQTKKQDSPCTPVKQPDRKSSEQTKSQPALPIVNKATNSCGSNTSNSGSSRGTSILRNKK